jgi:hypothetical protein
VPEISKINGQWASWDNIDPLMNNGNLQEGPNLFCGEKSIKNR